MQFQCLSLNTVYWRFYDSHLPPNAEEFRDISKNEYYLTIKDVQLSNAGNYVCHAMISVTDYVYYHAMLEVAGN